MANHKKDPAIKVVSVCASVHIPTKEGLQAICANEGVNMAQLIGGILDQWVVVNKDRIPKRARDERQEELPLIYKD